MADNHPAVWCFPSKSWEVQGWQRWRHFPPPANINARKVQKKVWRDQKRSAKKSEYAWREKGTFQFQLHKSWSWQQISHSQSTCPDRHWTACNISAHVCCPSPTLPVIHLSCLTAVCLSSWLRRAQTLRWHTWRLRSIGAIARMNRHRWRGLVARCSHTCLVHISFSDFGLHLLKLKPSCPLAVLGECTCWGKRICLASILVRLLRHGWCQQTQSNFSAEWWWALVWINLSSHKMKVCQDSCNQIR